MRRKYIPEPTPSTSYPGCWEIHLTQGKAAIVDDSDIEYVRKRNWSAQQYKNNWYARTNFGPKSGGIVLLHRYLNPDEPRVDHINGDGLDCRRSNMRPATHAQNISNAGLRPNNTSGCKGVFWSNQKGKWQAKIGLNYKHIHLGFFDSVEEAGRAYDDGARVHHGEYARVNYPLEGERGVT